jgi:predicted RNase H-like HicB family nuclease
MDDADAKHMLPPSEADARVCGFLIERTEQTPAGQFFATSPELPGLIVADSTREQLEAKIPEAIGALLRAYVNRSPSALKSSPPEKVTAPTPSASDLSNAAKAWYTRIVPQPTVHGRIQGLAAALAEAKAEQHAADVAALRKNVWDFDNGVSGEDIADFLEQRK